MRAHLRTYPAEFYYSSSVWEQDHTKVERIIMSQLRENGPAMAGPAGPVPAPMYSDSNFATKIFLSVHSESSFATDYSESKMIVHPDLQK